MIQTIRLVDVVAFKDWKSDGIPVKFAGNVGTSGNFRIGDKLLTLGTIGIVIGVSPVGETGCSILIVIEGFNGIVIDGITPGFTSEDDFISVIADFDRRIITAKIEIWNHISIKVFLEDLCGLISPGRSGWSELGE